MQDKSNTQKVPNTLRLVEVISAFSYALDLTEGQPAGHCLRCCWIGMHVGQALSLSGSDLWDLYYTLLLKDAGCSSNAARLFELYGSDDRISKYQFKTVDSQKITEVAKFVFTHAGVGESLANRLRRIVNLAGNGNRLANEVFQSRCERGAEIALKLGFNERIASGIRYLDEHWNGRGHPYRLKEMDIPVNAQLALLSQVIDVFFQVGGKDVALDEIAARSGTWFHPQFVSSVKSIASNEQFWKVLAGNDIETEVRSLEPSGPLTLVDEDHLDRITEAFGLVVDAKSPYTYNHSGRVAQYVNGMADYLSLSADRLRWVRRAAFLHDVGKLGVSNAILDKPAKLTDSEWNSVKNHAVHTGEILKRLSVFAELAQVAGAHHERLDGKGYPLGLAQEEICMETRMITVADIFDALSAARPYRDALPQDQAFAIMHESVGSAIDLDCLRALENHLGSR